MSRSFFIATLGCPKNEVDSEKLAGRLVAEGYEAAGTVESADLVVVNTCAFIEPAREESIEAILELSAARSPGARLAVTGCLAERCGEELAEALPEIDVVAGLGMELLPPESRAPAAHVRLRRRGEVPAFDLLELPRPASGAPWAYVKVAEGCDRRCGFCAIPSFRGRQRSRSMASILSEVDSLEVREVVLVAQDLASFGRDRSGRADRSAAGGPGIVELVAAVAERVERVRLLYIYPSSLTDELIDAVVATGVPYFDLSLQHVSAAHLRRMRRVGDRRRYLERIGRIRRVAPHAALRSSFILGYPGETEADHDELLQFIDEVGLDWGGFFTYSAEEGTPGAARPDQVPAGLANERLQECSELQDAITARCRAALAGSLASVLVDAPGVSRSYREAPEIDGVIEVPASLEVGTVTEVTIVGALGPDLVAEPREAVGAVAGGRLAAAGSSAA